MTRDDNDAWESVAQRYAEELVTSPNDVHFGVGIPGNRTLGLIPSGFGCSALDVGCGAGENIVALALLGYSVTGIDICKSQLHLAHSILETHGVAASLENCSLAEFSRRECAFDLIVSVGVGHFSSSPQGFVTHCARCAKPSARLVLSLPHPLDMIADWTFSSGVLTVTIGDYFPDGDRIQNAHYWRRFAGHLDLAQGMEEYLWRPSDVVNAMIENEFELTGIYEPRADHSPEVPCRYRNPRPEFVDKFSARVPQYIIYVARRRGTCQEG